MNDCYSYVLNFFFALIEELHFIGQSTLSDLKISSSSRPEFLENICKEMSPGDIDIRKLCIGSNHNANEVSK
jgi:hypothetical protein